MTCGSGHTSSVSPYQSIYTLIDWARKRGRASLTKIICLEPAWSHGCIWENCHAWVHCLEPAWICPNPGMDLEKLGRGSLYICMPGPCLEPAWSLPGTTAVYALLQCLEPAWDHGPRHLAALPGACLGPQPLLYICLEPAWDHSHCYIYAWSLPGTMAPCILMHCLEPAWDHVLPGACLGPQP